MEIQKSLAVSGQMDAMLIPQLACMCLDHIAWFTYMQLVKLKMNLVLPQNSQI